MWGSDATRTSALTNMLSVCLAVSVHSRSLLADTAAGCHFEEQLTFAFSLHQIHFWAWASDISDCVCVCVCTCKCVWWVTWACPPDILLDANGIHCHGSWRGGGHRCLRVNGACRSPVGVCMRVYAARGRCWMESPLYVRVWVWMFCLLTGDCVFALC